MSDEGHKRRSSDSGIGIHDLVIRIDANVQNLKEDVAELKIDFKQHKLDDLADFASVRIKIEDVKKELEPFKNFHYKVIGGGAAFIFILEILFKAWK